MYGDWGGRRKGEKECDKEENERQGEGEGEKGDGGGGGVREETEERWGRAEEKKEAGMIRGRKTTKRGRRSEEGDRQGERN